MNEKCVCNRIVILHLTRFTVNVVDDQTNASCANFQQVLPSVLAQQRRRIFFGSQNC